MSGNAIINTCQFLRQVALSVALAASALAAQAGTSFDTTAFWDGSNSVGGFGNPGTATYGQTFAAPSASTLNDFTFYLGGVPGVHLQLEAYVYEWSGSLLGGSGGGRASGSALYSSGVPITFDSGDGSFQPLTVDTGGVSLIPGNHYVAFLTVSNPIDYAASTGALHWGLTAYGSHFPGDGDGGFAFYNNGSNFDALTANNWDGSAYDFGDLAWQANFVPAPATLALLVVGAIPLRQFAGKRKPKKAGPLA